MANNGRREAQRETYDGLIAAIDSFAEIAYGSDSTPELAASRELSIKRYLGTNINPAPAGRSQVRDRTTFETIEWIKPSLLRIFCGSDTVVEFDPVGPEDEEQAKQESDYTNFVVTQRNNWPALANDWFHDALLLKNGYAYAKWRQTKIVESQRYENLSDDSFALLMQDKGLELVSHDSRPDDEAMPAYQQAVAQAQQQHMMVAAQAAMSGQPPPPAPTPPPPPSLHTVVVRQTKPQEGVHLCTLPPERCLIDIDTPDWTLEGCNYFEFWDLKTIGQLRAEGLDIPDDIADDDASDRQGTGSRSGIEELARDLYNERGSGISQNVFEDPSLRTIRVRYIWIRHDYDNDGIPELQYVIRVGREVLFREECRDIPVASLTPIPLAHRHIGMSIADSVEDIEDINTNITRGAVDNLNLSNTPRLAASDRVNMSDLLDVRVGGIVRVDGQPPQELMPLVTPDVFGSAVGAIQFFDSRRMNRTGINAYFQGTDSNTLNKTASGINQLTQSAAQRVEMIARLFAIGVKRLFLIVHDLILRHGSRADIVRLRNRWVAVDPSEWRSRNDLRIVVGLGTGSKEGQLGQLGMLLQTQLQGIPLGIATPDNIYHTAIEMAKATGQTGPDSFFTDPQGKPLQQPPPPEVMVKQMELQAAQQMKGADMQQADKQQAAKTEFDKYKADLDAQVEKYKADLDARVKLEIAGLQTTNQMQMKQMDQADPAKLAEEDAMTKEMADLVKALTDTQQASSQALTEAAQALTQVAQAMAQAAASMSAPRTIIRDKAGRVAGSQVASLPQPSIQ